MARFRLRRQVKNGKGANPSEQLVTLLDPGAMASEAYRSVRTRLMYAATDAPPAVILITSPGPADGKSTTCANLAVVLAQAGKQTLVIDGDLREPSLHKILGVPNVNGVGDVLSGEFDLSKAYTEAFPGLEVLSAGPIPPNPAELLSSGRFAQLIDEARLLFDYVLIDSPPTEMVSDAMIIATQADAVLLVLDAEGTSRGSLRKAINDLETVGAKVLGTVVNKTANTESGYHGYGYS